MSIQQKVETTYSSHVWNNKDGGSICSPGRNEPPRLVNLKILFVKEANFPVTGHVTLESPPNTVTREIIPFSLPTYYFTQTSVLIFVVIIMMDWIKDSIQNFQKAIHQNGNLKKADRYNSWNIRNNNNQDILIYSDYCEQYWPSPGGNTPQSSRCTATYHPSRKLSKLDEPDMRDTAGEVVTIS